MRLSKAIFYTFLAPMLAGLLAVAEAPVGSHIWNPTPEAGRYRNPVLFADYSDPDVIRVGSDFYMVASSFDAVPGLPLLHSTDLVHWELIGHALHRQPPYDVYSSNHHGAGVWAPAIRQHKGEFYIFYPDPDYGIYMLKAPSIHGPWTEPVLIKAAKGWIDPCPLWDEDGNAYLISGLAGSRAGVKNALILSRMAPDGTKLLDEGTLIIDGHLQGETLEGPKIYRHGGYYYVFAPGGGVAKGYQLVYRSKNIYGPYESRVVLAQGKTSINGPHQGAWVNTPKGEDWFLHFQDRGPYGRVICLEPMQWGADGWPHMGVNEDAKGKGEPVESYRLPAGLPVQNLAPPESDEFNGNHLGLQWQWQVNPQPSAAFMAPAVGALRLISVPVEGFGAEEGVNLWNVPHVLMQKFPGPAFTVTTKVKFTTHFNGEETGLVVMGQSYSTLSLVRISKKLHLVQRTRINAEKGGAETSSAPLPVQGDTFYLRATVSDKAVVNFFWSTDGEHFEAIGTPFTAIEGRWVGAKVGLYALGGSNVGELGYGDYDWFHIDPNKP